VSSFWVRVIAVGGLSVQGPNFHGHRCRRGASKTSWKAYRLPWRFVFPYQHRLTLTIEQTWMTLNWLRRCVLPVAVLLWTILTCLSAREAGWSQKVCCFSLNRMFTHERNSSLGNTCYMNATVQTLRAVPELQQALSTYVLIVTIQPTNWHAHQICTPVIDALARRATRSVSGYGKNYGQYHTNAIPRHPTPSEIKIILNFCTIPTVIFRRILNSLR